MKKLLAWLCFVSLLLTGCSVRLPDGAGMQEQAEEMMDSLTGAAQEIAGGSALESEDVAGTETDTGQEGTFEAREDMPGAGGETDPAGEGDRPDETDSLEQDGGFYEDGWAYTQLSAGERQLYEVILKALPACEPDVSVDLVEEEAFDRVFQCVMNDHPEIFYVDGYTFTRYTKGDQVMGNSFSGSYLYDRAEIAERTGKIEEKAEEILRGMPDGSDEYEKVKYIYEYLVAHTEYVRGCVDNQNICSVFLNGESVCQGYAKAAQYLFGKSGIASIFVSGKVGDGEDHVWNLVRINGAYYHVDITWGDASYVSGAESGFDGKLPQINYEYLCVPDSQLARTHTIDNIVPVPVCDSMEANYYVREGAYFETADMEKAAALFDKAYEDGTDYVTLKCADSAVYKEMEERLVEQQQVFRYLQTQDGTVAYTTNEEQLHLSFWL